MTYTTKEHMTTTTDIKLSKETLGVLKNFSTLNSNILIKPGNIIKTITPSKNGMAEAVINETFDATFGIWDLNKFLGVLSLFSNPSLEFGEKFVLIRSPSGSCVKYFYSEPKLLTVPTKSINMPEVAVSFSITEKMFIDLQKASAVMQLPDISFVNEDNRVSALISDLQDPTTNNYKIEVGETKSDATFSLNFKIENLKILPGDYDIDLAKNVVGKFTNKNVDLKYWFAMETSSTFSS